MNPETIAALRDLNRRFYRHHATAFSASRRRAWKGWERLTELAPFPENLVHVLDVGCGNGRFAAWLSGLGRDIRYVGVDDNPALLDDGRRRDLGHLAVRWLEGDVLDGAFSDRLGRERFDWIVLFGVLHHVPAFVTRRDLLRRLAAYLRPGGALVASIWRFTRPGYERKLVPWKRWAAAIDLDQLEPGDHLVSWSGDEDHPRYCHLVDDDEIERLLAGSGLRCRHRFSADGRGGDDNLYLVLIPAS